MHCKFLVFLLIVFLFFSFFLSACEFRLIERMGAHGKQIPDFILVLLQLSTRCMTFINLLKLYNLDLTYMTG